MVYNLSIGYVRVLLNLNSNLGFRFFIHPEYTFTKSKPSTSTNKLYVTLPVIPSVGVLV